MARCAYTIRDRWGVEQCENDAEPDSDYCTPHGEELEPDDDTRLDTWKEEQIE